LLAGCSTAAKPHPHNLQAVREEVRRSEQVLYILMGELQVNQAELHSRRQFTRPENNEALRKSLDLFYQREGPQYIESIKQFADVHKQLLLNIQAEVEILRQGGCLMKSTPATR
jgi:hypothetical protein